MLTQTAFFLEMFCQFLNSRAPQFVRLKKEEEEVVTELDMGQE